MAKKEYTEEEKEIIQNCAKDIILRYLSNDKIDKHCTSSLTDSEEHYMVKEKKTLKALLFGKKDLKYKYDIKLSFEYARQLFYRDSIKLYLKSANSYYTCVIKKSDISKELEFYMSILSNLCMTLEKVYHNKKDNENVDRVARNLFKVMKETIHLEEFDKVKTKEGEVSVPRYYQTTSITCPTNKLQLEVLKEFTRVVKEALN